MFFHGGTDSRLAGGLLETAAVATGVRLTCRERPGFGRSTYQPGRELLDWSSDVEQLADRLDLGWFGLVGHSSATLLDKSTTILTELATPTTGD